MSENDYIAEYVKEKYPSLLGFDFALWKFGRQMLKVGAIFADAFNSIAEEEYKDE